MDRHAAQEHPVPGVSAAVHSNRLSTASANRLLGKLGLTTPIPVSGQGLSEVYGAWCRAVPFDNVMRRIQISEGDRGHLPGWTPLDFIRDHCAHGVGGPCAPASAALGALLQALGFETRTVLAAIEDDGELAPDHATVVVSVGQEEFLVDTVILCESPILLIREGGASLGGWLHPIAVERGDGSWRVDYASAMTRAPANCTVIDREVDTQACQVLYQATQESATFQRFNSGLYIRRNAPGSVSVIYRDRHVVVDEDGRTERQISPDGRRRLLVEGFGLSQEIVARLPGDAP